MRNPLLSSRKFEALVQNSLEPGEQLIWAGEEGLSARYYKIVVASIVAILLALPFFLLFCGSMLHTKLAPFCVILYFGLIINYAYKKASQFVVVTDKRIILMSKTDGKPECWLPIDQVKEIKVKQTAEDCGDLIFVFKMPLHPDKPNGKKCNDVFSQFCIRGINQADKLRDSLAT